MVDDVTNSDQSYWDWIKQKFGIVPSGLPTYPANSASSVVTADPNSTGFIGLSPKSVGEQVRDRLGMQPLTYNNPGGDTYMVDNNNPFVGPDGKYNYSDLAYALGLPGFKPSYQIAEETARANAAPDKRDYAGDRAYAAAVAANKLASAQAAPDVRDYAGDRAYTTNVAADQAARDQAMPDKRDYAGDRAYAGTMPLPNIVDKRDYAGDRAYAANVAADQAARDQAMPDKRDYAGDRAAMVAPPLPAPISITDRPVATVPDGLLTNPTPPAPPAAPQPPAPTGAPAGQGAPQSNGFMGNMFGAPNQDPNGINPTTGLTNAQTRMLQTNMFLNLGGNLLAAGEQMMPYQRAQILSKLGNAMPDANAISAMQTRLLENNKLARENAQQANLAKIMQSPDFQAQFKNMPAQYQALAQAAAANGDLNGVLGLIEKTQPQFANGMIINRQAGTATDTISGQRYDLSSGMPLPNTSAQSSSTSSNGAPADYSQYGIPQGVRVNSQYFDTLPDEYKQRLAKVVSGEDTLSGASRGNATMMQRMQMDAYRAFPDYNPLQAQNMATIQKSFSDTKSPRSLYNQAATLGTFAQHENGVLDKAQKLDPGPLPAFDAVRNEFLNASGDPRIAAFNTELHMLQGEVGKMVRAGVLTDQEQNALNANISAAKSPQQIRTVLDAYHELVNGRINAVDAETQRQMGPFYDPKKHSLINDTTQKQFDQYNSNNWGRPQAAAAPKPGKYKWNPQTGQMEPQ